MRPTNSLQPSPLGAINMQKPDRKQEKKQVKETTLALMSIKSNQPQCKTCGQRFIPDKEDIEVDLPDEEARVSRTAFTSKPDYCSQECRVAEKL